LDLETLDEIGSEMFRSAFREHHMVLIHHPGLECEEGVRLTELLGAVSFRSPVMQSTGGQKFSFISNQHAEGRLRDGELLFHSDHTFFEAPLKAISLYALAVPVQGGETVFTDAGKAYRRLSPELRQRIEGLQARHVAAYGAFEGNARPKFEEGSKAKVAVHPVVWRHPDSGEPILFVSRLLTESILGLSHSESEALLEELFEVIEDPAHVYMHKWREGDYLVWDNRQLQHSRRDFAPTEKRALRRVPID
jgi:taurine dioxygenase